MKPRKVIVTIELLTDMPTRDIKGAAMAGWDVDDTKVVQVQVNVVKNEMPKAEAVESQSE